MAANVELSYPAEQVALVTWDSPPMNFIGDWMGPVGEHVLEAKASGCSVVVLASDTPGYYIAHGGLSGIAAGSRSGRTTSADAVHSSPFFELMTELERGPMVSIAAVHGQAWGGGAEFCWACDLRIAAESATFGQPETIIGIIPGAGGTSRLPRIVGRARALELVLEGAPITAQRALAWGAVNRVVPDADLRAEAIAWAGRIASRPGYALAAAKQSVVEGLESPTVADAMRNEWRHFSEASARPETAPLVEAAQARYEAGEDSYAAFGLDRPGV